MKGYCTTRVSIIELQIKYEKKFQNGSSVTARSQKMSENFTYVGKMRFVICTCRCPIVRKYHLKKKKKNVSNYLQNCLKFRDLPFPPLCGQSPKCTSETESFSPKTWAPSKYKRMLKKKLLLLHFSSGYVAYFLLFLKVEFEYILPQ